jgi:hypothetical protein
LSDRFDATAPAGFGVGLVDERLHHQDEGVGRLLEPKALSALRPRVVVFREVEREALRLKGERRPQDRLEIVPVGDRIREIHSRLVTRSRDRQH